MNATALAEIKEKFAERVGVETLDEKLELKDLGLDSLDVVELLLEIEDEYNVKFESSEVTSCKTVRDLYKVIESKL